MILPNQSGYYRFYWGYKKKIVIVEYDHEFRTLSFCGFVPMEVHEVKSMQGGYFIQPIKLLKI